MGSLYPADFPRMDHWLESASQSDSLFMDGFLYISSIQARAALDRRGRDGELGIDPSERSRVV